MVAVCEAATLVIIKILFCKFIFNQFIYFAINLYAPWNIPFRLSSLVLFSPSFHFLFLLVSIVRFKYKSLSLRWRMKFLLIRAISSITALQPLIKQPAQLFAKILPCFFTFSLSYYRYCLRIPNLKYRLSLPSFCYGTFLPNTGAGRVSMIISLVNSHHEYCNLLTFWKFELVFRNFNLALLAIYSISIRNCC